MVETDRLLGRVLRKDAPVVAATDAGLFQSGGTQAMNTNETSGQESGGRTDSQPAHRNELAVAADEKTLKRARWEHLRLAACSGARHVNVTNYFYGVEAVQGGEHTYTVTVERGQPTDCTCPAAEYQSGPCKHAVAVADDREVLDEAMHGGSGSVRQYTDTDDDANAN